MAARLHDQYHGQSERSRFHVCQGDCRYAVSLTGGRGQNPFFPTRAQIAIQTGFEVLRHMEAYVTIPNIHRLLLNEADANAAIETLMNKGDQRSHELVVALRDGFFGQPPEQLAACRER